MSDFIADDIFGDVVPETDLGNSLPSTTDEYKLGRSHWFEDETPFHELVKGLIASGDLSPSPYKMPLPYLSVSQVELYQRCPMQFYFRYIKGEKRPPGVALVQGTTIHKAVEEGYKKKMRGEEAELEFVLDTYSGALDKGLEGEVVWDEEDDGDNVLSKDSGKMKDQGVGLLKQWHKHKLPKVNPRGVEKSFITSFGGVPVVGRVDLVDRIEEVPPEVAANLNLDTTQMHPLLDAIVDNKVVGKTYTQAMVNNKMQMTLYSHASGVPRQRYDLFVKTKTPKLVELMTSRNAQQIAWAAKTFVDVAKAISTGSFPPCSPDQFYCSEKWCGFYTICRGGMK